MRSKHQKSLIARRRQQRTEEHEAGRRRAARDRRRRGVVGPDVASRFDELSPGQTWGQAMNGLFRLLGLSRFGVGRRRR